MPRDPKDGVKTTYFLDRILLEELKKFCDRTGRTMTKVVEIAIREYLEKHKEEES